MRVIGIDPGLLCTGFGILDICDGSFKIVDYGVIKTNSKDKLNIRLKTIYEDLSYIIKKYTPSVMSIEEIFYGKNVKAALLLGHARGIPVLLSANNNLPLFEFSARRIKQSLTGNGNATKEQVQFMVKNLLSMDKLPQPLDASDALAIAVCYKQNFRI
ncbi:MAG: crossover junction endodeoxyribonuclease RuvC [Pelagibacteraceae bacterium TMED237]|nr:crossover junction endodeoxyribonuclease RuvC [Candidatus Neomarinimicrobiota bacterium]OUW96616.1 MAG: crossover junction endodeoxyribonuclease RuvC [Pelagibacteraceae bacterium TMED237]